MSNYKNVALKKNIGVFGKINLNTFMFTQYDIKEGQMFHITKDSGCKNLLEVEKMFNIINQKQLSMLDGMKWQFYINSCNLELKRINKKDK